MTSREGGDTPILPPSRQNLNLCTWSGCSFFQTVLSIHVKHLFEDLLCCCVRFSWYHNKCITDERVWDKQTERERLEKKNRKGSRNRQRKRVRINYANIQIEEVAYQSKKRRRRIIWNWRAAWTKTDGRAGTREGEWERESSAFNSWPAGSANLIV